MAEGSGGRGFGYGEYAALGKALAAARGERGLAQAEVAARVGVSATYLSKLERGWSRPSAGLLRALAGALATGYGPLAVAAGYADGPAMDLTEAHRLHGWEVRSMGDDAMYGEGDPHPPAPSPAPAGEGEDDVAWFAALPAAERRWLRRVWEVTYLTPQPPSLRGKGEDNHRQGSLSEP